MTTVSNRAPGPVLAVLRAVMRSPRLKRLARRILQYFPKLQAYLQRLVYRSVLTGTPGTVSQSHLPGDLSPRASRAYQALKQAQQARKK
jgi:hypothetical protein